MATHSRSAFKNNAWCEAEQHLTPDDRFRFVIITHDDGDVTLGFEGFPSHTHADILAALTGLSEAEAVHQYVVNLLEDRSVIAVWRVSGEVRDVWVSLDPARDTAYPIEGETIELRYWSGRQWASTGHRDEPGSTE